MGDLILSDHRCEHCDGEIWRKPKLDGTQRSARFCTSGACVESRRAKHTRKCVACGIEYKTAKKSSTVCSKSCSASLAGTASARAAWRHTPEAIAKRENRRKAKRLAREAARPSKVRFARCRWCGAFMPPRQLSGLQCHGCCTVMMVRVSAWASHHGLCPVTDDLIAEYKKAMAPRGCVWCGNEFIPYASNGKYCSKECNKRAGRLALRATDRHKARKRIANHVRRARKYKNGPVEKIDPWVVFDRDGWRCHVCGVYTPKGLRGTHDDRAPELDHVVPLAAGGTHTFDNVKCSCRSCNGEKGATIYQADMFIGNVVDNQQVT